MTSVGNLPEIKSLITPGPKAQAWLARDEMVVAQAYGREQPFVMDHGLGTRVYDVDGNGYLDFGSGIGVAATGHAHPEVVAAVQQQAARFLHISSDFYHEGWVALSEALAGVAPFTEKASVFLCNSGAEAVEAALKLATYYTGRNRFISFLGSFHGRTQGALMLTGSKVVQRRGFVAHNTVTHVPYPNPYRPLLATQSGDADLGETVVNYIEGVIMRTIAPPDTVAAIIVEPIQGEGGYIVPPRSFLSRLRELCDRHGILLIADEVQSGMGRTGRWWAVDHWSVAPDIVCSAKGLASGVPVGAILYRKTLDTWRAGAHGNTFGGNPLACAAALATFDILRREGINNAADQGAYLMETLTLIARHHPSIGQIRGRGLMIGIEFVNDRVSKEPAPALRDRVNRYCFEHGLLLIGCGMSTTRFIPPLLVTREEIDEALRIFEYALTLAEAELLP
jgi:4-aminobutyrate aminotransferase